MPRVVGQDMSVVKRVTCRDCGAINEYSPYEVVVFSQGRDISGTMSTSKGIHCASCGHKIVTYSD